MGQNIGFEMVFGEKDLGDVVEENEVSFILGLISVSLQWNIDLGIFLVSDVGVLKEMIQMCVGDIFVDLCLEFVVDFRGVSVMDFDDVIKEVFKFKDVEQKF